MTSLEAPAASAVDKDGVPAHSRSHETEVVVIGSGLGGLCCAAMLATYGVKVSLNQPHLIHKRNSWSAGLTEGRSEQKLLLKRAHTSHA